VPLIGGGGGAQRQLFLDWSYAYRVSYANLQLNYFRNSSLSASLPALNNNTVDFVQSDLALSKEQKNETLLPAKDDSLRLLDNAKINRETGEMVLGDADDLYEGWPILGVTYLLVNSNPPTTKENQCKNRQEFARFIRWTLVNNDAED
jgi:ABC-type phosphate transport system substrate-binding protein